MLFDALLQDLRYGARTLRRNAGFTTVSILALALGIGVNTAVFTAYKAFVARPLDARDPGKMVNWPCALSGVTSTRFSYPDYEAYRDRSVRSAASSRFDPGTEADGRGRRCDQAQRAGRVADGRLGLAPPGAKQCRVRRPYFIVSENYFTVLGVSAIRGRTFESYKLQPSSRRPPRF